MDNEVRNVDWFDIQLPLSAGTVMGSQWGCIMRTTNRFAGQEGMCRGRATVAKKEMEYWLAEAAEWKRLRESSDPFIGSIPTQLDWCAESNNH